MPHQPKIYFDDFSVGQAVELGPVEVSAADILAFARQFDPQPFHVDEAAARASIFGGLIASGPHTLALFVRLLVEAVLNRSVSLGSPGFERLSWPAPVRPGDTLRGRWTVLECRTSRSRPDRGIVRARGQLFNQRDETVLEMEGISFFGRRTGEPADGPGA